MGLWRRFANSGRGQQANFDASRNAPALLALKTKFAECLGKWLSQAQTVKQVKGHALRVSRINGIRQLLQRAPPENRPPHRCRGKLRTRTGQNTTSSCGPGQIGRASCRERGERSAVAVAFKK